MHGHTHHSQAYSPAMVQAFATRNLQFLALIENTIDRLESDTGHLRVISLDIGRLLAEMQAANANVMLDPEGLVCELLDKSSETTSRIYAHVMRQHQSAQDDKLLTDDDGLADAFAEFLNAVRELHDAIEGMREWIETHDALIEPSKPGVYSSVDDLFAAIGIR